MNSAKLIIVIVGIALGLLASGPAISREKLPAVNEEGMELVGVFYPAGSPAVNYKTSG